MAVASYHEKHGHFPPPYLVDENGKPMHSWRVLLLPFVDEERLYKQYDFSEPWDGPNNRKLAPHMPRAYSSSGDPGGSTSARYLAIVGEETVWNPTKKMIYDDIKDGSSSTILLVETVNTGFHWMEPRDFDFDTMDFTIGSPNGVSGNHGSPGVAFLDGSGRSLRGELTPNTLRALLTVRGGEDLRETGPAGWELLGDRRLRLRRRGD